MTTAIRLWRLGDLPAIRRLTVEGFDGVSIDRNIERAFGLVAGRDWRERKVHDVEQDCAAQPDGVFVAEAEGMVAGYITTRLDHRAGIGRIPNLAVDAGYRRQGIGTELIRHALAWMQAQGMALAKIETLLQNERGQALYPKLGFQEVARQIHYVLPLADAGPAPGGNA